MLVRFRRQFGKTDYADSAIEHESHTRSSPPCGRSPRNLMSSVAEQRGQFVGGIQSGAPSSWNHQR